jgi:hypothetical protein
MVALDSSDEGDNMTTETIDSTLEQEKSLIALKYPVASHEICRIHHLWGHCWRINVHDTNQANNIIRSTFIIVRGQEVIEKN